MPIVYTDNVQLGKKRIAALCPDIEWVDLANCLWCNIKKTKFVESPDTGRVQRMSEVASDMGGHIWVNKFNMFVIGYNEIMIYALTISLN